MIHGTRQALFDPRDGLVSFSDVMLCWSMDEASTNICFGDVGPSPKFYFLVCFDGLEISGCANRYREVVGSKEFQENILIGIFQMPFSHELNPIITYYSHWRTATNSNFE